MRIKVKSFATLLVIFCLSLEGVVGQAQNADKDSLLINVYAGVQLSSEANILPHYLVRNQFGEVDKEDLGFLGASLHYDYQLSGGLDLSTGFSFRNDLLSSHFVNLTFRDVFYFQAGRVKRTIGGLEGNNISSGSLGLSRNARPVPLVEVGFNDYVDVPFTQGYFKVKGNLSQRWLESDRYISDALLHGKTFYLQLDLSKEIGFKAASGLVHFVQYGGVSPQGDRQPSGFSDYLRLFFGGGIPNPDGTTQGESNGLGNHVGIVETTVEKQLGEHTLKINYQKPFEDQGGLQYVSLTDYLFGLEWTLPDKEGIVSKVYVEWLQTKWQGGPGLPDPTIETPDVAANFGYPFGGRDDTYNNWLYQDGWTYEGLVLGNPFFLTHQHTLNFFDPYPDHRTSIANNRLRAFHLGIEGNLLKGLSYRGLFSYTENFGTYAGLRNGRFNWGGITTDPDFEYPFLPGRTQYYTMVELIYEKPFAMAPLDFSLTLARDFGDFYNASGLSFVMSYDLIKK